MYEVGLDVVEQALVVGDDDGGVVGRLELVDASGHDAQGVDVEAGVGLVEDAEPGLEHCHLEDFVALLLSAGETLVDGAGGELVAEVDDGALLAHELEELGGGHRLQSQVLALGIDSGAHEVDHAHAGNLDGILESEEEAEVAAFLGGQVEQVVAHEGGLAPFYLIGRVAGQHHRQGGLAGAVGAHDGMHLAGLDFQVDAAQYLFAANGGAQVFYFKYFRTHILYTHAGVCLSVCSYSTFGRRLWLRSN